MFGSVTPEFHSRDYLYISKTVLYTVPYFLKYSRNKIFAVGHNLCISEIIRASKFYGLALSAKINTPRKLSIAKVNEC